MWVLSLTTSPSREAWRSSRSRGFCGFMSCLSAQVPLWINSHSLGVNTDPHYAKVRMLKVKSRGATAAAWNGGWVKQVCKREGERKKSLHFTETLSLGQPPVGNWFTLLFMADVALNHNQLWQTPPGGTEEWRWWPCLAAWAAPESIKADRNRKETERAGLSDSTCSESKSRRKPVFRGAAVCFKAGADTSSLLWRIYVTAPHICVCSCIRAPEDSQLSRWIWRNMYEVGWMRSYSTRQMESRVLWRSLGIKISLCKIMLNE